MNNWKAQALSLRAELDILRAREASLVLTSGPVALDRLARTVRINGQPRRLCPLPFAVLEALLLAGHAGCSRAQLLAQLWPTKPRNSNIVNVAVAYLRAALAPCNIVETVRANGGNPGGWRIKEPATDTRSPEDSPKTKSVST
jgi:DNA-binding response OmpR family regulator